VADKIKVIFSPAGGRLTWQGRLNKVKQVLQEAGLDYHLESSQKQGEAIALGRQAALEGWPIVVAAGGDGTINEVANGLIQAAGEGEAGTLGIIPLGTANDLAYTLQLPQDINLACRRLAAGNTRLLDVGQVNGRYFINNSAVGLEAAVTAAYHRILWVKGKYRYILAALHRIILTKPWQMSLSWNEGGYEGPITLVSVGTGPRTGGSFLMTPQASPDDGLLDFVYGVGMSRWRIMWLLPKTFSGRHIDSPLAVYRQTQSLRISSSPPTPIQVDGEIIEENATEINYRIIPGKLRVIV